MTLCTFCRSRRQTCQPKHYNPNPKFVPIKQEKKEKKKESKKEKEKENPKEKRAPSDTSDEASSEKQVVAD